MAVVGGIAVNERRARGRGQLLQIEVVHFLQLLEARIQMGGVGVTPEQNGRAAAMLDTFLGKGVRRLRIGNQKTPFVSVSSFTVVVLQQPDDIFWKARCNSLLRPYP